MRTIRPLGSYEPPGRAQINPHKAVAVSILGVDARVTRALELVLKHRGGGEFVQTSARKANVAIFDMDRVHALEQLQSLRVQFPALKIVTISSKAVGGGESHHVLKPLSTTALFRALRRACGTTQDPGGGRASKARATDMDEVSKAALGLGGRSVAAPAHQITTASQPIVEEFYSPGDFIQGRVEALLEEARAEQKLGLITCLNDRYILIDPGRDQIRTNFSGTRLNHVAIIPIDGQNGFPHRASVLDAVNTGDLPGTAANECVTVTIESFIWRLAALTSHGRLPKGTPSDAHIYLKHWPNFTRLEPIPEAMRITAYMIGHPCSLGAVVRALLVSRRHVNTFYSAASAIGLAGIGIRKSDQLFGPRSLSKSPASGILKALLGRLSRLRITSK